MNNLFKYEVYTKNNTKSTRFCDACNSGFTTDSKLKAHVCAKNIIRARGRYQCTSCDYESHAVSDLWDHVDKVKHNGIWSACGIKRCVMTLHNSPTDCICAKCGKGFINSSAADKHFAECRKRRLVRNVKTVKYSCRKCGHSCIMKHAAQRHFRRCNQQLMGGSGALMNRLDVQKKLVNLNMTKYNEQLISKQIFRNTNNIFQRDDEASIKALCTFHTIAERLAPGAVEVEKRDIYFTSNTEQVFEIDYQATTQKWAQQLSVDIDEWVENGSGFAITNIVSAQCVFVAYKDDVGGNGEYIPEKLYKRQRLVRVINTPLGSQECFKTCLALIRNGTPEIAKNTLETRRLSGVLVNYPEVVVDDELKECIQTYSEPFVLSNIPKIARELNMAFNVFRLHKDATRTGKPKYWITTIYAGRPTDDNQANILYYDNHFCKIYNLKNLLGGLEAKFTRQKMGGDVCATCLAFIDSRYFNMVDHYKSCKLSAGTVTKYAKEGDAYKFRQHNLMVDHPAYFVADFEACNSKNFDPIQTENTSAETVHKLNSYCFYLHISPDLDNFPYEDFNQRLYWEFAASDSEDDQIALTRKFFAQLIDISDRFTQWCADIDPHAQLLQLKRNHKKEFADAVECCYCNLPLNSEDKVFDHNHYTCTYVGAAHSQCNLLARRPTTMPVFFHNMKYDMGVILPLLGSEHAYGAPGSWRVNAIGNSYTCVYVGNLEFKDTYKLLPLSLKELGNQLSEEDCILQRKFGIQCGTKYGKGVYPYEWLDTTDKFSNTAFPLYEDFASSLSGLPPKADYDAALAFFNSNCATFKDYHLYYLQSDVLILADALQKFSQMIHKLTGMFLTRAMSIPQASYAGLWHHCKLEVPHIVDPAMYGIAIGACKGGLNVVAKRVTEVKNHLKEHIQYWDIKSMYPTAMSEPLPCGNYKWLENPTVSKVTSLCSTLDLTQQGALVVVGIFFPAHTHDNLRDFPPVYDKRVFPPSIYPQQYPAYLKKQTVPKLTPHLVTTWTYTCTIQELLVIQNLGGKVHSVQAVITYDVSPFCASYIAKLRELRQEAIANGNHALSLFIKLLMNSIYGKIYQDESKYLDVKIVTDSEAFNKIVKSPRYKSAIFNKHNVITVQRKRTIKKKALALTAAHILGLSKASFLYMWYFEIKPAMLTPTMLTPHPAIEICYIDTDSLIVFISMHSHDLINVLQSKLKDLFDFSNLPKHHALYNDANVNKIGIFKDEVAGKVIEAVYASSAKCYSVVFREDVQNIQKCKGVPKALVKKFTRQQYRESCLMTNKKHYVLFSRIGIARNRQMALINVKKITLNGADTKRMVINGGHSSLPFGHYNCSPNIRCKRKWHDDLLNEPVEY